MRRKTVNKRTPLTRGLLHLLNKINQELDHAENMIDFQKTQSYHDRRETLKKIYEQQSVLFETGEYPKNRIVSIHKNYLRPIVRGKEKKKWTYPVFWAKCMNY